MDGAEAIVLAWREPETPFAGAVGDAGALAIWITHSGGSPTLTNRLIVLPGLSPPPPRPNSRNGTARPLRAHGDKLRGIPNEPYSRRLAVSAMAHAVPSSVQKVSPFVMRSAGVVDVSAIVS
jgi:hypothetical protein